jgi:hypothetical protein
LPLTVIHPMMARSTASGPTYPKNAAGFKRCAQEAFPNN